MGTQMSSLQDVAGIEIRKNVLEELRDLENAFGGGHVVRQLVEGIITEININCLPY